jgi:uncharacterized protein YkwD
VSSRFLAPALILGVLAAAAGPARADTCPDGDLEATADNEAQVAQALMCEMNARRLDGGLAPLSPEAHLDRSARYHADDMAFFGFFAHRRTGGPSVLTRIKATGYFDHVVSGVYTENLADAPSGRATAAGVVDAWMQSEYHRENLLLPAFRDAGVAIEPVGPDEAFYADTPSVLFVVDYGRRYYRMRYSCHKRSASTARPRRVCRRRKPQGARS